MSGSPIHLMERPITSAKSKCYWSKSIRNAWRKWLSFRVYCITDRTSETQGSPKLNDLPYRRTIQLFGQQFCSLGQSVQMKRKNRLFFFFFQQLWGSLHIYRMVMAFVDLLERKIISMFLPKRSLIIRGFWGVKNYLEKQIFFLFL